jgi:hypothetical protein
MTEMESILSALPVYQPDPKRAARLRARCRGTLRDRSPDRSFVPAMVIGGCVVYLSGVLRAALLLYGF